jgi:hypothetical protein
LKKKNNYYLYRYGTNLAQTDPSVRGICIFYQERKIIVSRNNLNKLFLLSDQKAKSVQKIKKITQ